MFGLFLIHTLLDMPDIDNVNVATFSGMQECVVKLYELGKIKPQFFYKWSLVINVRNTSHIVFMDIKKKKKIIIMKYFR